MKNYLFTAISGVLVWFFATMFFVLFGEYVLFPPGTDPFIFSTFLLIISTGILLWIVTYVYSIMDKADNAALKFGVVGTFIGLTLDTFSLANHQLVFPSLNHSQVIAFSTWMSFAYALYLLIPYFINQLKKN